MMIHKAYTLILATFYDIILLKEYIMKDYLNYINEKYPIRKTTEEKSSFLQFAIDEGRELGYEGKIETIDKHNNLFFGNLQSAKVVFTAHYDTPSASFIPNLMMPRNPLLSYLYAFSYPILLAILSYLVAFFATNWIDLGKNQTTVLLVTYLILYLGSYFLTTRCFKNKHNINDNTSGVSAILAVMAKNPSKQIAFVLFDNEEKGLLGSKAFAKKHKELLKDKLIINFDCVGNGEHIIFVAKKGAKQHHLYALVKDSISSNEKYQTYFYPIKGSVGNSDYKSFENGVGVMACKKGKLGFYTDRIHTKRDTVSSFENILFLTQGVTEFLKKI